MNREQRRRADSKVTVGWVPKPDVKRDEPHYWLAVRGAAVPSHAGPLTVDEAAAMIVSVGATPSEPTLWIRGHGVNVGSIRSNYECLFGFATAQEMRASQRILVTAPLDQCHAEVRRLMSAKDVPCLRGAAI